MPARFPERRPPPTAPSQQTPRPLRQSPHARSAVLPGLRWASMCCPSASPSENPPVQFKAYNRISDCSQSTLYAATHRKSAPSSRPPRPPHTPACHWREVATAVATPPSDTPTPVVPPRGSKQSERAGLAGRPCALPVSLRRLFESTLPTAFPAETVCRPRHPTRSLLAPRPCAPSPLARVWLSSPAAAVICQPRPPAAAGLTESIGLAGSRCVPARSGKRTSAQGRSPWPFARPRAPTIAGPYLSSRQRGLLQRAGLPPSGPSMRRFRRARAREGRALLLVDGSVANMLGRGLQQHRGWFFCGR
ncbi:hypothetical protein OH77DRAFT_631531 [Trametes cingulata]|nr:hypothetical protein OH77DRAFT_631531 [Trametes cingulata]